MERGSLGESHYRGDSPIHFTFLPVVNIDILSLMWVISHSGGVRNLLREGINNPEQLKPRWMAALRYIRLGVARASERR